MIPMSSPQMAMRVLLLSGLAVAAAGCATLPGTSDGRSESLIDRNGIDVVAADAGRQLVYFKDHGTRERVCHAPSPDFSRTAGTGMAIAVPTFDGGELGVGSNVMKGAVDLGGRDAIVLVARELLYRACELAANTQADAATEREIYARFLSAVVEIAKSRPAMTPPPPAAAQGAAQPASLLPMLPTARRPSGSERNPHDYDPPDDDRRR